MRTEQTNAIPDGTFVGAGNVAYVNYGTRDLAFQAFMQALMMNGEVTTSRAMGQAIFLCNLRRMPSTRWDRQGRCRAAVVRIGVGVGGKGGSPGAHRFEWPQRAGSREGQGVEPRHAAVEGKFEGRGNRHRADVCPLGNLVGTKAGAIKPETVRRRAEENRIRNRKPPRTNC